MKVKLQALFIAKPVFDKIFNTEVEAKTAYWLGKISSKLESHIKDIEAERLKLVEKYADDQTKEQKEKNVKSVGKKMKEFADDFGKFLEQEKELDIQPISFDLLSSVKLSANDFKSIEVFVKGAN